MKSEHKRPLRDAWFIWFILGMVMLNYPFLHIFNKEVLIYGIPLTVLYFYVGWPVSIFVIYLFSIYLVRSTPERNEPKDKKGDNRRGGEL